MNDFGKNLNSLRKLKGWTQTELADKLGVTNQAISKWENGDSFPDTALLIPLSELFGVSVDYLLKGRYSAGAAETDDKREKEEIDFSGKDEKDAEDLKLATVKPAEWKKKFSVLLCAGLAAIFAGVIEIILVGILNEDFALYGATIMMLFFAAGVPVLVYAGMKDSLYYLNVDSEIWKPTIKSFAIKTATGVGLCIIAAAIFVFAGLADIYPERKTLILATTLTAAFVMIFAAVALFIVGGLKFSNVVKDCVPEYRDYKRKEEGLSRFSGVIMLTATAIFLVLGFLKNLWHPAWIVFPVGGILCGILDVIQDGIGKKDKSDKK